MRDRRVTAPDDDPGFDAFVRASVAEPAAMSDLAAMRERIVAAARPEPRRVPTPGLLPSLFRPVYAFGAAAVVAVLVVSVARPFPSDEPVASRADEPTAEVFSLERAAAAPADIEAVEPDPLPAAAAPSGRMTDADESQFADLVGLPLAEVLERAAVDGYTVQVVDRTDPTNAPSVAGAGPGAVVTVVVDAGVVVAVEAPLVP